MSPSRTSSSTNPIAPLPNMMSTPTAAPTAKIRAVNLNFFYNAFQALHGVNIEVKDLLSDKTEELLRTCVLSTKSVHLRVQTLRALFIDINQEFEAYSGIVKSFEDQIDRVKNDTRQVYQIPSKTLSVILYQVQRKITALKLTVEDLAQIAEINSEADFKEVVAFEVRGHTGCDGPGKLGGVELVEFGEDLFGGVAFGGAQNDGGR